MQKVINTALIAVTTVLLGTSMAFATTQKVRATVPFPFVVGKTAMPAGTYTIFPITDNEIEVSGAQASALESVIHTSPNGNTSLDGELEFDRVGNHYFLRGVQCDYTGIDVAIPVTAQEESARAGLANSHQRVVRVVVAAR